MCPCEECMEEKRNKKYYIEVTESNWGWHLHLISKNGRRFPIEGVLGVYDFKCKALKIAQSICADAGWELKVKEMNK